MVRIRGKPCDCGRRREIAAAVREEHGGAQSSHRRQREKWEKELGCGGPGRPRGWSAAREIGP
ncbi:hypothetical protein E2562_029770 [Oryza meyeriana var. granulata]|uniref:Uncharacterized protein n=1 Tax=Oryza meyeriana var. granulata TaxID=110450 RepID=A0A6G1E549_9ORYZ|nr:hypothetical protein E2562_029770 [Oryza meyeriana var. granulata]